MEKLQTRQDDYKVRRAQLKSLNDEALKQRFWALAETTVAPLITLAQTHTSPAIERSILLRMGFSSLEAKAIVEKVMAYQLMGKGAGHVVYRYARLKQISIRESGLALLNDQGWGQILSSFGVKSC